MVYPFCLSASVGAILTMYCYEQDLSVLLYSSLPTSMKTPVWFAILLPLEANMLLYSLMSVSLIFQLHILFPLKLAQITRSLATFTQQNCHTAAQTRRVVGQIRCVQLLVSFFNIGHRNVIHCIKLLCIVVGTVNGYAAITHSAENIIFGIVTSCMLCDATFLYAFVYEKAFAIPDGLQNLKRVLKLRLIRQPGNALLVELKGLVREIDSIPVVGLRVGDFHMLERTSTPVFVDYVLQSIVNLLVML